MGSLKEEIEALKAAQPQEFVCVEQADRERPAGILICPWDGLPVVIPWIRFDCASYGGAADQPELAMVFSGHRVMILGVNLLELAPGIREQRLTCLRALPPGYLLDEKHGRTWIIRLEIHSRDGEGSCEPSRDLPENGELRRQ